MKRSSQEVADWRGNCHTSPINLQHRNRTGTLWAAMMAQDSTDGGEEVVVIQAVGVHDDIWLRSVERASGMFSSFTRNASQTHLDSE